MRMLPSWFRMPLALRRRLLSAGKPLVKFGSEAERGTKSLFSDIASWSLKDLAHAVDDVVEIDVFRGLDDDPLEPAIYARSAFAETPSVSPNRGSWFTRSGK